MIARFKKINLVRVLNTKKLTILLVIINFFKKTFKCVFMLSIAMITNTDVKIYICLVNFLDVKSARDSLIYIPIQLSAV